MKYLLSLPIIAAVYLALCGPWELSAFQSPSTTPTPTPTTNTSPLDGAETPAAKIARLEAARNRIFAEFQAARAAAAQLDALQKLFQDADVEYRAAIDAAKKAAGLDSSCTLVENSRWECAKKPEAAKPTPTNTDKKENKQ